MTLYLNLPRKGRRFVCKPFTRRNAKEKLQSAIGVGFLYVQFEGQPHVKSESQIEKGVAVATSAKESVGSDDMKLI